MASTKTLISYLNKIDLGNWVLDQGVLVCDPISSKQEAKARLKALQAQLGKDVKIKLKERDEHQFQIIVDKTQLAEKFDKQQLHHQEAPIHPKRLYIKLFTGRKAFILNLNQAKQIIKMGEQLDKLREDHPTEYQDSQLQHYHKIIEEMLTGNFDFQGVFKTTEAFEEWKENMRNALFSFQQQMDEVGKTSIVKSILQMPFFENVIETLDKNLLKAIANKNLGAASTLLLLGANPKTQDDKGASAFNLAIEKNDAKMVLLLLSKGVDINEPDKTGQLPLIRAIQTSNTFLFDLLRQRGANIHYVGQNGNDALMAAAARGHSPFVRILLALGADVDAVNSFNQTALDIAIARDNKSVVKLINDLRFKNLIASDDNHKLKTKVSAEEWDYAKNNCQEGKKLHKKDPVHKNHIKHSFVKIKGNLYVFDAGKRCYLGQGSYKRVKRCMREDGKIFAMAVQGVGLLAANNAEDRIMDDLMIREGQATRKLDKPSKWLNHSELIKEKSYSVLAFEHGKELFENKNSFSELDRLFVARDAAIKIAEIHEMGFVHRDVKPENMMHHQIGFLHYIKAIDFGFATEVDENGKIRASGHGSPRYLAPECFVRKFLTELQECDEPSFPAVVRPFLIKNANREIVPFKLALTYKAMGSPRNENECFSSPMQDIFSLGVVFKEDLKIREKFVTEMLRADPATRPSLRNTVVPEIETKIAEQLGLKTKTEMIEYFKVLDGVKIILAHLQEENTLGRYSTSLLRDLFKIYDKLSKPDMQGTYAEYQNLLTKDNQVFKKVIEMRQFNFELMKARKDPGKLIALITAYDGPKIKAPSMVMELMQKQNFAVSKLILEKFEVDFSTKPKLKEKLDDSEKTESISEERELLNGSINGILHQSKMIKIGREVGESVSPLEKDDRQPPIPPKSSM